MIETPTVFVLGAGASMPYGFPSGQALREMVLNVGETKAATYLVRSAGFAFDQYTAFHDALDSSKQPSVDAFLERRPEFISIGKLMIAIQLCKYEQTKFLFPNRDDDWHVPLLQRMDARFEDFDKNRVSFVTFNYDRSLEHALYTVLQGRYGKSGDEVAAKLRPIPIVHVHGQLGYLGWQEGSVGHETRAYEPHNTWAEVSRAANGIRIICEDIDDSPEFSKARELLLQAKRIYFLGFGYGSTNLRRLLAAFPLTGIRRLPENVEAVGTCFGFTQEERARLQHKECQGLSTVDPSCRCSDFFRRCGSFLMTD